MVTRATGWSYICNWCCFSSYGPSSTEESKSLFTTKSNIKVAKNVVDDLKPVNPATLRSFGVYASAEDIYSAVAPVIHCCTWDRERLHKLVMRASCGLGCLLDFAEEVGLMRMLVKLTSIIKNTVTSCIRSWTI